jgi:chemotaxis signal transduction protein
VPGSRPHLLGLAQFAGEPLAVLDLHAMAEGLEPQSHHRTTVILGRGARDSRAAIGIAATEALRVQALPGGVPSEQPGGLVSSAVELGDELIRVVDTLTLVDERWSGGGSEHV